MEYSLCLVFLFLLGMPKKRKFASHVSQDMSLSWNMKFVSREGCMTKYTCVYPGNQGINLA